MKMTRAFNAAVGLAIAASLAGFGCGQSCPQVQQQSDAFKQRIGSSTPSKAPHMSFAIPTGMVTKAMNAAIKKVPAVPFDLPGLGDLSRYAGNFSFSPRSLSLVVDKTDSAQFAVDFDVKRGNSALFGLEMAARAPVQLDQKSGKMTIALRADMFEKVRPRIDGGAVDRLTDAIYGQVPSAARLLVSRNIVKSAAQQAITQLADRAYSLLREKALTPLGELARFSVDLPDVPIESLGVHSVDAAGGYLRMDVRTSLPVSRGLEVGTPAQRAPASPDRIRMEVSTGAVVALANWAMGKGKLPAHYDQDGKPQANGDFEAGVDWVTGARPLKVHMWSLKQQSMCVYALAGGTPSVGYEDGKVKLEVKDSNVEAVTGPPLVQAALAVTHIGKGVFDFSKTISTGTQLRFGPDAFKVNVETLKLDGERLVVDLSTGKK